MALDSNQTELQIKTNVIDAVESHPNTRYEA